MAKGKVRGEVGQPPLPTFVARAPGRVILDESNSSRDGHLDVVSSGAHGAMRIGITCADRSVSADLSIACVRRIAESIRPGTRILRAETDVAMSGILAAEGGIVLLVLEDGEVSAQSIYDQILVSIAIHGAPRPRSSRIAVRRRDLDPAVRALSSVLPVRRA